MLKVELDDTPDRKVFCPFCGALAVSPDGLEECAHTLFQASDDGFEYVSSKLSFGVDVDLGDDSIDEYTDKIEYPNAIKFAIYQPAPSLFGGYVAFADD